MFNVYLINRAPKLQCIDSPELFVVIFEDFSFARWEIFHDFLSSAVFFFKIIFLKTFIQEYHQCTNSLDPHPGSRLAFCLA